MGQPVVHFEVISSDPDKLREFFGELFGWGFSDPMGPTNYTMIERHTNDDGVGIAGGIGGVPEGYDGHVTFYVEVDDVGQALDKVEQLGGKKMMGPDQVPDGPVIGLFTDPQGHVVGLVGGAATSGAGQSSSGEGAQASGNGGQPSSGADSGERESGDQRSGDDGESHGDDGESHGDRESDDDGDSSDDGE